MTPLEFVSYPYSHSLVFLGIWGLVLASRYSFLGERRREFMVLFGLVLSHWILDFITHRPDMPLYPRGPEYGLGLWNSAAGTLIVEFALFTAGVWIYARATRGLDRIGSWGLPGFATLLAVLYLAALSGAPPSVAAIWITGIIGAALILLLSAWLDKHRTSDRMWP